MFTVTNKNDNNSGKSPLTSYVDAIDRKQALANIDKLVNSRELSTDDEIYHITGTIAQIEKISEHLHVVTEAVPQALVQLFDEERQKRHEESTAINTQFARDRDKLHELTRQAIERSGRNINSRLSNYCWGLGGCIAGMGVTSLLAYLLVFPHQLSLARGSDGAMLEWLSTSDGKILRRAFVSGNKSVEECIRKGLKKTGKTVCMLELK
jgi:hypothetical protein